MWATLAPVYIRKESTKYKIDEAIRFKLRLLSPFGLVWIIVIFFFHGIEGVRGLLGVDEAETMYINFRYKKNSL